MTTARFSTGVRNVEDGPKFSWEYPVPDNDFWRSFQYPSARNFLQCFSQEESNEMQLNERYGTDSPAQKSSILINILHDKITSDEVDGRPLHETNATAWEKRMMAMVAIYGETNQLAKQIQVAEAMVEHRADKANLSNLHSLAALLTRRGDPKDFVRAEELERSFTPWVDGKVGQNSPQSLSSRRIVAKAVWMQGRQAEATILIDEIFVLVEGMRGGSYAVYLDSERKMTEELLVQLKEKLPGGS